MSKKANFVLPYEPAYTDHRQHQKRRQEVRDWLRERERRLGFVETSPSLAPQHEESDIHVWSCGVSN
jgi:hypothetical protein